MKKIIISLLIFLGLIAQVALANGTNDNMQSNADYKYKLIQFILVAQKGSIHQLDLKKLEYRIQLVDTNPKTLYLVNEPRRIFGNITTARFLKRWQKQPPHDYKTVPPNAALVFTNPLTGKTHAIAVILKSPQYDVKTKLLKFIIQPLSNKPLSIAKDFVNPIITMASPVVCGTFGSWGDLPGEQKLDVECHQKEKAK